MPNTNALEQALHHRATLFARGSRNDDGKLLIHDEVSFHLRPMKADSSLSALMFTHTEDVYIIWDQRCYWPRRARFTSSPTRRMSAA